MVKSIENKFNRIVENSDPQELEDKSVEYTIEAMDEVMSGNKDSLAKLDTALKFFKDHKHINRNIYARASKRINEHIFNILSKKLENVQLFNDRLKLYINLMGIIDLMNLNYIIELLNDYQENKDKLYFDTIRNLINELKINKIKMLDQEIIPVAFNEINKVQRTHPEIDDISEEFVSTVKTDIHDNKVKNKNKKIN